MPKKILLITADTMSQTPNTSNRYAQNTRITK